MLKNWSTYNFQLEVVVGAGGVHPGDDGLWLGGDQAEAEEVRLGVQGEAAHREVVFYKTWKIYVFIALLYQLNNCQLTI